jgi:Nuclease-related domain
MIWLYPDQRARPWQIGAAGEEVVGRSLDSLASQGVLALHDRKRPRTSANIDHIAVGPSGVFVIDTKHYQGQKIRVDIPGSVFRPGPKRLMVGRRDETKMIGEVGKLSQIVGDALKCEARWSEVAVLPMLVFVNSAQGMLRSSMDFDGVWVGTVKQMGKVVTKPGLLDPEKVEEIALLLAKKFGPR